MKTAANLLTARQVAEVLQVSTRTVWRLAADREAGLNKFPRALKLSSRVVRFHTDDLQAYLDGLRK